MLVAMIVGIVSIWHTERSVNQVQEELSISREELRATREGQITDRYTAAVENLGDDSLDVRLGGIYALKRIMQDSPRDQGTVVDVLAAYVRAHAVPPKSGQKSPEYLDRDVAAAVTVLATRDQSHDPQSQLYDGLYLIDLSGTWLKGLVLRKADLRGVYLRNSNLSGSELHDVDLGGATLIGSNMRNVNFFKVNLEDAVMDGADLQNAKLTANLQAAALRGANLRHAYLESAMLQGANLDRADLRDTRMCTTTCTFEEHSIQDAWLVGADLRGSNINAKKLLNAAFNHTTRLPDSLANHPKIKQRLAQLHGRLPEWNKSEWDDSPG
ncbi:hypothetical protein C0036_03450 [Streptomyces sp. DJ]|nr:hypothetical protein C0036_03450 [Streptomyces sp. DJ]